MKGQGSDLPASRQHLSPWQFLQQPFHDLMMSQSIPFKTRACLLLSTFPKVHLLRICHLPTPWQFFRARQNILKFKRIFLQSSEKHLHKYACGIDVQFQNILENIYCRDNFVYIFDVKFIFMAPNCSLLVNLCGNLPKRFMELGAGTAMEYYNQEGIK